MKILAICGSYRKQGVINALMDKAIEGIQAACPSVSVEKVHLMDRKIEYCRGCMVCFHDDPAKHVATCVIKDDMQELCGKLDAADGYIFGTPIFCGTVTAVMKTFCERFAYVLGRPGRWPVDGCPTPRNLQRKAAILIMSTAIVPRLFRYFCDDATKFFRETLPCVLNAKIVGSMYAGKGRQGGGVNQPERFFPEALALGEKLARAVAREDRGRSPLKHEK